ncbi:MAG: hypothetical protein HOM11_10495 [Methylococcales bacterium]|jgi:hypothetical protein|nr:hypothetical protein [Methylococcales bacterium]MBT7442865.1 hypothetical protein [Methylococcales bacterium]
MTDERALFSAGSEAQGLQVVTNGNKVHFSVNDDTMGDSSTGYGATVSVAMTASEVADLAHFLSEYLVSISDA